MFFFCVLYCFQSAFDLYLGPDDEANWSFYNDSRDDSELQQFFHNK
jgi:hypothetical protein